jgi:hypothetical protein
MNWTGAGWDMNVYEKIEGGENRRNVKCPRAIDSEQLQAKSKSKSKKTCGTRQKKIDSWLPFWD